MMWCVSQSDTFPIKQLAKIAPTLPEVKDLEYPKKNWRDGIGGGADARPLYTDN